LAQGAKMKRIACIGEAMIELSMDGDQAHLAVAGDTLNTAIYLKRSWPDVAVDYVTCLGQDMLSKRIVEFIAANDLGHANIQRIAHKSPGLYAINTAPDGERSFTYWRGDSAARQMFSDADFRVLEQFDGLYLSGITLAILPQNIRLALLEWLYAAPVQVIFDSNYRAHLWEDRATAQKIIAAFWQRADIALPSIDDEMDLFCETETQIAQRFFTQAKSGALKRGARGPLSLGEPVDAQYEPVTEVLDTTAAGDSFNGGYLGALLAGKGQAAALQAGHAMAARVVQFRGAIIPK
jgi:2-dehydro-3-deoxygluconokinase